MYLNNLLLGENLFIVIGFVNWFCDLGLFKMFEWFFNLFVYVL